MIIKQKTIFSSLIVGLIYFSALLFVAQATAQEQKGCGDEKLCDNRPVQDVTHNYERVKNQLKRITGLDQKKPRKNVIIIGAGMSGLVSARELKNLGHTVTILEASNRIGGRIWTHTFSNGTYHELGAMRVPASHDYTRYYISQVKDPLDTKGKRKLVERLCPFITAHENANAFYYMRGKKIQIKNIKKELDQYKLTPQEKEIILKGGDVPELLSKVFHEPMQVLERHLSSMDPLLNDKEWLELFKNLPPEIDALERQTFGEFLDHKLKGVDAKELVGVASNVETILEQSLSSMLRDEVVQTGTGLETLRGGLSLLPEALASELGEVQHIRFNTEVTAIEVLKDNKGVKLTTRTINSEDKSVMMDEVTSDYVICTIPFGVLRRMEVTGVSPEKMTAIRNLSYDSSTKVLLNFTERFWEKGPPEERIIGGASISDQVIRATYYPNYIKGCLSPEDHKERMKARRGLFTVSKPLSLVGALEPSKGGALLGSYTWGQDARRIGSLSPKERAEVVVTMLEKIHPNIREYLHPTDWHASMFWDTYPWSRGAFSIMRPYDIKDYFEATIQPEGRLFFAGEHCSFDQAWIQGAIKSALNAVEGLVGR